MGASRAVGALLCIVCVVVGILYAGFILGPYLGMWIFQPYTAPLWLVLPVVIGVFILAGLGFWLGWIMASTKEVSPAPSVSVTEAGAEEKKKGRRRRR